MSDTHQDDEERMARRKLLKLGVYSAPAIIGTLAISRRALAGSCGPLGCGPAAHLVDPNPGRRPPRPDR